MNAGSAGATLRRLALGKEDRVRKGPFRLRCGDLYLLHRPEDQRHPLLGRVTEALDSGAPVNEKDSYR